MPSHIVRTDIDRDQASVWLANMKPPFLISVTHGSIRSYEQNRLAFLWYREIAEQMGDRTPTEVRGHCKLHHGIPILRADDDAFREKYDRLIRDRSYEEKLEFMVEPFDFPVTRLMGVRQMERYLDAVAKEFTAQGVALTQPIAA